MLPVTGLSHLPDRICFSLIIVISMFIIFSIRCLILQINLNIRSQYMTANLKLVGHDPAAVNTNEKVCGTTLVNTLKNEQSDQSVC